MNPGVLKHEIRQKVIPDDRANLLKKYLPQLYKLHQISLMSTVFQWDALECFKSLYYDNHINLENLTTFKPLKICLFLKYNRQVFNHLIYYCSFSIKLIPYFKEATDVHIGENDIFYYSIIFFSHNNFQVAFHLLNRYKNDELSLYYIKMLLTHCKKTYQYKHLKPYTDKFYNLWKFLDKKTQYLVDETRVIQEDKNILLNFPWQYFIDLPIYCMYYDILLQTFPDNYWLTKKSSLYMIQRIEKFFKSCRKISNLHYYRDELIRFPWKGFINMPVYLMLDILCLAYPDNPFLQQKMKSVTRIDNILKIARK